MIKMDRKSKYVCPEGSRGPCKHSIMPEPEVKRCSNCGANLELMDFHSCWPLSEGERYVDKKDREDNW